MTENTAVPATWEDEVRLADALGLSHYRISEHLLLIDLVWPAHNAYNRQGPTIASPSAIISVERLIEATALARFTLEPIMSEFGPISIAAGFDPAVPMSQRTPHSFCHEFGAAVDISIHNWVNPTADNPEGNAPINIVTEFVRKDIPFSRFISYAGSENICISNRTQGLHGRVYENRRTWTWTDGMTGKDLDKPEFLNHAPPRRSLKTMNIDKRSNWRRQEGEPIFHTQRSLRPQHIRTGQFFTLLDFCRSEIALLNGIGNAPPVNAAGQIRVARMMSEILDPVVAKHGRISVLRALECKALSEVQQRRGCVNYQMHRWNDNGPQRLVFSPKWQADFDDIARMVGEHPQVSWLEKGKLLNGDPTVIFIMNQFEPSKIWTSAREDI